MCARCLTANFVRPTSLRRTRSRLATVPANRKSSRRPPPAAGAEATQARPPHTHRVCQVYASALPVAYGRAARAAEWEPFARLVLRAAYEATLAVGALKARDTGRRQAVYLTSLGGGAFGNRDAWITEAVRGALHKFRDAPLDVYKVHYGTRVAHAWTDVGSEYPEPTTGGSKCLCRPS